MVNKIVLVGCGLIGSYHLQGIVSTGKAIKVDIVEINRDAIKKAKERILPFMHKNIKIEFFEDLSLCDKNPDLTIVATHSTDRVKIINKLLSIGYRYFLLEKMVCQSKSEYDSLIENFAKYGAKGWVNTIRRYNKFYRDAEQFFKKDKIVMNAIAENLGLSSNAIHYLDLFKMFSGNSNIKLSDQYIYDKLLPNKRGEDLVEFMGTIVGNDESGSFVSISFLPFKNKLANVIIIGENARVFVDEANGKAFLSLADKKWQQEEYSYEEPRVSEITPKVITDILEKSSCLLPTVEDSYDLHLELFRIFNNKIRKITNKFPKKCPIT